MLYTADFETCTRTKVAGAIEARVWAWATASIDNPDEHTIGTELDEFMRWIGEHPGNVYFHNLGYDGKFLIDWLYAHGWQFDPSGRLRRTKLFTTLVGRLGQWYSIKLRVYNPETKQSHIVKIYDSLKLLPLSVEKIALAFELPEGKGKIDYERWRPEGYEMTEAEEDYIRRDVEIMARALHVSIIDEGMTRMTIGANAMASWKKGFKKQGAWRNLFPKLGNVCDTQIRQSYRGGFTWLDPQYKDVDIEDGISVDFNSMYPSMMISKDFPYGTPVAFSGQYEEDPRHPLYVQEMLVSWRLREGCIPFIKPTPDGIFDEHEYPEVVDEPVWMWITSVDLALMQEMYDLDVWAYGGGWKFSAMPGERIFGEYVSYWGARKRAAEGGKRLIAKLYLNNLYGKFATRPEPVTKMPFYVDEGGYVAMVSSDRYPVYNEWGELTTADLSGRAPDPVYIPVAAFCTAYARDTLVRAAMANRDRFVYCDTDSMHLIGTEVPAGIRLHDSDFCAWKVEGTFTRARHLRAKTYIWDLNGEFDVVCAGMPDNIKEHVTWENFHIGFSNLDADGNIIPGWGKLLSRAVAGGVQLYEAKFEIRGELV